MFKLTISQFRQFDEWVEAQFEKRLAETLEKHFFADIRGSSLSSKDEMRFFVRKCVERAKQMGIASLDETARFGAWAAAYQMLNDEERGIFGPNIGALFLRPGTSGAAALALADYRLERLAASHPFAVALMARMKAVRESLR